jgi:hypothetical protein
MPLSTCGLISELNIVILKKKLLFDKMMPALCKINTIHGWQFHWRRKSQYTKKITDLPTFVSDLWQVVGFLRILWFPPPIKLTATI